MRKISSILILAAIVAFNVSAFGDEFSNDADIKYSYDEAYDEIPEQIDETSDQYDSSGEEYDSEYDETVTPVGNVYGYWIQRLTVLVDGTEVEFDVQPTIINERTMVPMRAIFEALGASVTWNGASQTATGMLNGISVSFTINQAYIIKNGEIIPIDSPAVIIDDRTLVPVRAIAESFGCTVNWYGDEQVVEIISE